ncbi:hypothetical protein COV82_06720 [Candidatus Peregrinibacteria bacterium CG11_big_fil_rev_8_21_14_0_20_46_8]|nr:MAG: hypothetical protein COV82_06720 [Candidatus Peregrinibacteria bacterium CG11_big_fil_rev_8_21_14_0_20_46_8]
MQHTELLYMKDFELLETDATVLAVEQSEDERHTVILNRTIFYAQGGGQPYDQGAIRKDGARFRVEEVRFVDGIIHHIGHFEHGIFAAGDTVHCTVDAERRMLNSRYHSAGHVIDKALIELGMDWVPSKGHHFPGEAYDEYHAELPGDCDKEQLMKSIEEECDKFIAQNPSTTIRFMPVEEMHNFCRHVPENLPKGKPSRLVLYGNFGMPCGGTHVMQLAAIKKITIRKIKAKGGKVKVSYEL